MKIQDVKIFICDHCKTKMFGKGAMTRHERLCNSNPENFRACSGCVHCEEESITYISKIFDDECSGGVERTGTTFRCKVFDKIMYPFKAEKKNLINRFPDTFKNQVPMPKTCDKKVEKYSYGNFYD